MALNVNAYNGTPEGNNGNAGEDKNKPAATPQYYADSAVNLDKAVEAAKAAVEQADDDVESKLNTLKAKTGGQLDPAALANVQHALNQWSISYNLAASTNRSIKDLMSGIIQKI